MRKVSIYGINAEVKENGTISDEFFPELLTSLANVRRLDLSDHDFRRFPESITKCHSLRELNLGCCHYLREIRCIPPKLETLSVESCTSLEVLDLTVLPAGTCCLRKLTLDGCVNLQKIKGISPNIEDLSALRCESLTNSSRSMLLNQGLHEKAGNILLSLPGNVVPEWFEHYSMRQSIFFWFRGDKFPSISLCLAIGQEKDDTGIYFQPKLNVNGKTVNAQHESEQKFLSKSPLWLEADHIFIFDLKHIQFKDEVHLEKRWNHAEVCFDTYNYNLEPIQLPIRTGLHEFKSRSSTVGIRFISPYERDYDSDSNSMASTQISSTTNVKGQSTSTFNCAWTYDDVVLSFLGMNMNLSLLRGLLNSSVA
ncbi:hypothetical protein RIF29_27992 [Crotalaria pallida]|uniref:Uncharacterized protein n=1 Tax=Crotalaria pallida TaxID=3830 RepID=A0AAN9ESG5_CROPI